MSMTGFARVERQTGGHRWAWELRSVNGKGLEIRFRFPPGLDEIEAPARQRLAAALGRGNVQAGLTLASAEPAGRIRLNEAVLRDILVGSSRVDLQACKLEYSIVSPK